MVKKLKTERQRAASQRAHPQHPLVLGCVQQVHGLWLVVLCLDVLQDKQTEIEATITRTNPTLSLVKVSPSHAMCGNLASIRGCPCPTGALNGEGMTKRLLKNCSQCPTRLEAGTEASVTLCVGISILLPKQKNARDGHR